MALEAFMWDLQADPSTGSNGAVQMPADRRTTVRVSRRFGAPATRVFDAWLEPAIAGRWLFATASRAMSRVIIDARAGGAFCFVDSGDGEHIEHTGFYVEIARPRRLVFTLAPGDNPHAIARVAAAIVPQAAGRRGARRRPGCELIVAHEGVPAGDAARIEARWTGMLYGLGALLDS